MSEPDAVIVGSGPNGLAAAIVIAQAGRKVLVLESAERIGASSMGVEHAAMEGILTGVFNSIPYFGPVIVSGGLLVVGLVQDRSPTHALQMSGVRSFSCFS